MPRLSAGLLMYRVRDRQIQVFLAHPGGLLYARKDDGFWTIPKGEPDPDEDLLEAAKREFEEETGIVPTGPFIPLKPIKQKGGKIVHAWAFEGDWEGPIVSNMFTLEWPPRSGQKMGSQRWIGLSSSTCQSPSGRSKRHSSCLSSSWSKLSRVDRE